MHTLVTGTPLEIRDYAQFLRNKDKWWDIYSKETGSTFSPQYTELMNGMLDARPMRWNISKIKKCRWYINLNCAGSLDIEEYLERSNVNSMPNVIRTSNIDKAKRKKAREQYSKKIRAALFISSVEYDVLNTIPFERLRTGMVARHGDVVVEDIDMKSMKLALYDLRQYFSNNTQAGLIFNNNLFKE